MKENKNVEMVNLSSLSDEQILELFDRVKELKKNEVLKELPLREGEQDIRQLNREDKDQLDFRLKTDFWTYLAAINQTLVDLLIVSMEIAKKLGIEIEKVLDEVRQPEQTEKDAVA